MNVERVLSYVIVFLIGALCGVLILGTAMKNKTVYGTNLAKFEVNFEKCMTDKKATVGECQKLAEFKSKMCIAGCE